MIFNRIHIYHDKQAPWFSKWRCCAYWMQCVQKKCVPCENADSSIRWTRPIGDHVRAPPANNELDNRTADKCTRLQTQLVCSLCSGHKRSLLNCTRHINNECHTPITHRRISATRRCAQPDRHTHKFLCATMHRQLWMGMWKDSLANANNNNNNNGVWTEHRNKKKERERENNGENFHGKRMSWRIKLMENFTVGRRKLQCSSNFRWSIFSIVIRKNISPTRITLRTRCGRPSHTMTLFCT